ncbi:Hypothetical protein R9X50_00326000 [Acrodontium crateriforme]|uniref:Uncharacterized protein n=1 Tax=Acrodontium crateriforme TaxID=150365 RepID=A0AAQ3M5U9_9PEZI|nr:Hypothetical protein R9X50_00326000 [Acrodontium crateriforme]
MFSVTARRLSARMSTRPAVSAPYTRAVVSAMRKLYPDALADKSFDNTGLLLEAPFDPLRRQMNSVLLTIDLTAAVADEAIERNDSAIIAYHPIIFRGLKSLTLADTQQQTLLRLAAEGISVYSPHTAVDCQVGGLGDWLADIVTGTPIKAAVAAAAASSAAPTPASEMPPAASPYKREQPLATPSSATSEYPFPEAGQRPVYMLQHHPSQLSLNAQALTLASRPHKRYPIIPTSVPGHEGAGMGRVVRLAQPVPLPAIIDRIGLGLGNPKGFPIAIPQGRQAADMMIRTIAICAGSGAGVFAELDKRGETDIDLLFTGELSHHDALAQIERGRAVVCLFHSNTERGFLHGVLKPQLEETIKQEWKALRAEEREKHQKAADASNSNDDENANDAFLEALADESVEVHVSEFDRDPFGIMICKEN